MVVRLTLCIYFRLSLSDIYCRMIIEAVVLWC